MLKKLTAILLTILMILTCLPLSAFAATAPAISGNTQQAAVTLDGQSSVCAVISIDSGVNVQGLSFRLTGLGGNVTAKSATWSVGDSVGVTTFNGDFNYDGTQAMGTLLCDASNGYTFTKKTELVRIVVTNLNSTSASKTIKLVADEFYDKYQNDIPASKLDIRIEQLATPKSLKIEKNPDKLTYVKGTTQIDPSGAVVKATMSDGSVLDVTNEVQFTDIDDTLTEYAFFTFNGVFLFSSNYFRISLVDNRVEKLTVSKLPTKLTYESTDTSFDLAGLEVTATYTDETMAVLPRNKFSVSAYPTGKTGAQTVTLTSTENSSAKTSFEITINAPAVKTVTKIEVKTNPTKTNYLPNETTLSTAGIKITGTYNTGETFDATNKVTYSAFPTGKTGTQRITVTSTDNTSAADYFDIYIEPLTVTKIEVKTNPTKTNYLPNETTLSTAGIKITGTYNTGATFDATNKVTYSAFPTGKTGTQRITVTSTDNTSAADYFDIYIEAKALASIAVTTQPTKTRYFTDDTTLNTAGIKVTGTYNTGETYDATGKVTFGAFPAGKTGTRQITVTSTENTGITTYFNITIEEIAVSSLSVTANPSKTTYFSDDTALDTSGIKVTGTYNSGKTFDATSRVKYSAFPTGKTGTQRITVTSTDNMDVSTCFEITVTPIEVTGLVITNQPTKKTYYPDDKTLDTSGIKLTGTYNSGKTFDATSKVTYSGFTSGKTGTQRITVTSTDNTSVSTYFEVNVNSLSVTGIVIETQPAKKIYFADDKTLDTSGIKVTGTYNSGKTFDATSRVTYSGFTSGKTGTQRITVTSTDNTSASTYFEINVNALAVVKLDLTSRPTKKTYYVGDTTLDTTGIKVTGTYNSGKTFDATAGVKYSAFNTSTPGAKTITITMDGFSGSSPTFTVNVESLKVTGIVLKSLPTKTAYFTGENLDTSGMKIEAAYNNGTTQNVTSKVTVNGYDPSKAGSQTVTVSFDGCTAQFNVDVTDASVTGITVSTTNAKLDYFIGDKFDKTGIVVTASYNDGSKKDVSSSVGYTGFSSAFEGKQTVTAVYGSSKAEFTVTIKAPALTDLRISLGSAKTSYYVGDEFSFAGVTVVAHYENNTSRDVTSSVKTSGFDGSKPGKQTITVSYGDKTASYEITVNEVNLTGITVTPPSKTEYYEGDALDKTGLRVTASYSDGSFDDVTKQAELSGFDSSSAGKKNVKVTYGGKLVSFEVTVTEIKLTGITVTPPERTEYYKGDSLITAGMTVTAAYSNGEKLDVTEQAELTGFDSMNTGAQRVTVSYGAAAAEFDIIVHDVVLESVSVTPPDRTEYFTGDELDVSGMVLTAHYSNGTSAIVTEAAVTAGFDSTAPGEYTIIVSYGNRSASFTVTVSGTSLVSITVLPPSLLEYYVGDAFSADGLSVTANYSSGVSENVTQQAELSGADTSKVGTHTVNVSFGGKKSSFEITVYNIDIASLTVTPPEKTEYFVGEKLSTEGMTVTVSYTNGTASIVTKQVQISEPDTSVPGEKVVKVSYGGLTSEFTVVVIGLDISSLSVTPPIKAQYYMGDELSLEGLIVIASYTGGTSTFVTNQAQLTGFDSATPGEKTITVEFGGLTAEFKVYVSDVSLESISVKQLPAKTEYSFGESFNPDGMAVIARYSNGTSQNITQRVTITGFDGTLPGKQTVMVRYGTMTDQFEVTVSRDASVVLLSVILTPPLKSEYYIGDVFSTSGMSVIANYSDGTSVDVTDKTELSGFDSKTPGEKTITAAYDGMRQSFTVTVGDAELIGIDVVPPEKTQYAKGEEIPYNEIRVIARYSNGERIDVTDVADIDLNSLNDTLVTVVYGSFKGNCLFTRSDYSITGISLTPPGRLSYYVGDALDTSGMKVEAVYSNDTTADVTSKAKISGFDASSEGERAVTVEYSGFSERFTVNISVRPQSDGEAAVSRLELTPPEKLSYSLGEELVLDGMTVTAYFTDGSARDVTSQVTLGGYDVSTPGVQKVEVSYDGKTASFEITVSKGLLGDVNGDGCLDSSDALSILRYSVGFPTEDDMSLETADINGDGAVDSADALAVLRKSLMM